MARLSKDGRTPDEDEPASSSSGPPEGMRLVVLFHVIAIVALMVVVIFYVPYWGVLIAFAILAADSLYWSTLMQRGIDERKANEMQMRVLAERKRAGFGAPRDDLLGGN